MSVLAIARSLIFYAAFYGGSVGYVLIALLAIPFGSRAVRPVCEAWSRYHHGCARVLLGIETRVVGELPSEQVLVALKHESFFEAIDLPRLLDRPAIFAKAELFDIPLWGTIARRFGAIPVERGSGAKALRVMIRSARAYRDEGRMLAIFPEGTRIPHGDNAQLKSGFSGLYKAIDLPVVPIAVDSGRLYHRRWKRSGTLTYRVCETIPAGLARDEIEARVRAQINALNPAPLQPSTTDTD